MYNPSSTMKAKNQSVSSDAEAKDRLIVYVYEYLFHIGAKQSAQTFLDEIQYGKEVHASEGPGFLTNWWLVFWDLYCAASDKKPNQAEPSSEAKAFHEYNSHSRPSISSPAGPPQPADHHQLSMGPQGQPMPPAQHQPTTFMPRYGPPPTQQMRGGPGGPMPTGPGGPMSGGPGGPMPGGPGGSMPGGPGGPMPGGPGGPMLGGPMPGGPMPGGPGPGGSGSPMPVGPGGPPPNMMDAMGRSGPMGSPGYRSPMSVPRPQHPMSPMNPTSYQQMRPQNSMGGGGGGGGGMWEEYSMPNYGQENDQSESAEILKVKQNLQEEAKKLTFDNKDQEDYNSYM